MLACFFQGTDAIMRNDFQDGKTIAAISTAMIQGGISIVRISGPEALAVADRVFRSPGGKKKLSGQLSHTVHYGFIYDGEELLDEVLATVFRGPKSYTAEDTVEISCHGGVLVTRRVLEAILKAGAFAAQPGEFTKRAFLNGRIDLSGAEAVMDLIRAKNEFALSSSIKNLRGSLRKEIEALREIILNVTARIEASLDDPEHLSLDGYREIMKADLLSVYGRMKRMLACFEDGKILSEGIRTVILGKPNAGKSSLLNLFTGTDRAIVTEVAGTTRDTLEEQILIGGIGFIMVDTAGIRDTGDLVEQIGVNRARKAADEADLILYVMDASREPDQDDEQIMRLLQDKRFIILVNKTDLEARITTASVRENFPDVPVIGISAKTGEGLDEFRETVQTLFSGGLISMNDEVLLANTRQKEAMTKALKSLSQVFSSISDGVPEDFLTIDLMDCYTFLGEIIGEELGEDLVDRIFEAFCMGK